MSIYYVPDTKPESLRAKRQEVMNKQFSPSKDSQSSERGVSKVRTDSRAGAKVETGITVKRMVPRGSRVTSRPAVCSRQVRLLRSPGNVTGVASPSVMLLVCGSPPRPRHPSTGTEAAASEEGAVALSQTRSTHGELASWATWDRETLSWAGPPGRGWETQRQDREALRTGSDEHSPAPQHSLVFLGHAASRMKTWAVKGVIGHTCDPSPRTA